jgi:hypothetical protein
MKSRTLPGVSSEDTASMNPTWFGFFAECRRLAALARARRQSSGSEPPADETLADMLEPALLASSVKTEERRSPVTQGRTAESGTYGARLPHDYQSRRVETVIRPSFAWAGGS